jgi:hypothetical protein
MRKYISKKDLTENGIENMKMLEREENKIKSAEVLEKVSEHKNIINFLNGINPTKFNEIYDKVPFLLV